MLHLVEGARAGRSNGSTPAPGYARSTVQGRDQVQDVTLAGTRDGTITALSVTAYSNLGAYPVINAPGTPTRADRPLHHRRSTTSRIPSSRSASSTPTRCPRAPPRIAGARRRLPHRAHRRPLRRARSGWTRPRSAGANRSARPVAVRQPARLDLRLRRLRVALDQALAMVGYGDLRTAGRTPEARGKRLGVGIGSYVAVAGVGPSAKMGAAGPRQRHVGQRASCASSRRARSTSPPAPSRTASRSRRPSPRSRPTSWASRWR